MEIARATKSHHPLDEETGATNDQTVNRLSDSNVWEKKEDVAAAASLCVCSPGLSESLLLMPRRRTMFGVSRWSKEAGIGLVE